MAVPGPKLWAWPGDLFVSNSRTDGADSIVQFATGAVRSTFVSGVTRPTGAAFDQAGNLFLAVRSTDAEPVGTILKISPDGTQSIFAAAGSDPQGLAFDTAHNLYVSDAACGCVTRYSPNGTPTLFADGLDHPSGVTFDSTGNLYVATAPGDIIQVAPDGMQTVFATGLSSPTGLAFDCRSLVLVAAGSDGTIYAFFPGFSGGRTTFSSGLPAQPLGLAFSPADDLYVTLSDGSIRKIPLSGGTATLFASGLDTAPFLAIEPQPPRIEALGVRRGGKILIHGQAMINGTSRLQSSPTVNSADFVTITTVTNGANGSFVKEEITDHVSQRFYRLVYP